MINRTLIGYIWRDLRHREMRLLLLSLLFLLHVGTNACLFCMSPSSAAQLGQKISQSLQMLLPFWACIWGAGIIGIKMSRGTLPLLLARPITITSFVISSWLAIALACVATHLCLTLLDFIQTYTFLPSSVDPAAIAADSLAAIIYSFAVSAAIVCFSTLVTGVKDTAAYLLTTLAAGLMQSASAIPLDGIKNQMFQKFCGELESIASKIGDAVFFAVQPLVPFNKTELFNIDILVALITAAAVILTWLSLAIFKLCRTELSYAAD